MFFDMETPVYETEIVEFYENLIRVEGEVAMSRAHRVDIMFDKLNLWEILQVPTVGLAEYVWKEDARCVLTSKFTN